MVLKVYNTATRRKEVFTPIKNGEVKMYVCGITPYDMSHIGHARSYIAFDVIRRFLEYSGFDVKYVQNFTDVDDKIIERAKEEGIPPLELAQRYIGEYFKDMDALGVKRANSYPRVSEKIPQIIEVVQALVKNKRAYEVDGNVYLDVTKGDYGKLSRQSIEDLKAGARVGMDEKKRHPLDFALWKKAKTKEISWSSPWGKGRPGWHIECSVMSMSSLGPTLDIHGGGQDLIFPHHENEIAQSEAYTGKPFVRYWLHNGFVTVEKEKMSKSLGNFATVREVLQRYDPQTLRFFLLSTHYRKPLDFSERAVKDAQKGLLRIQNTIFNLKNALEYARASGKEEFRREIERAKKGFVTALEDDFNVPKALAVFFDFIRAANTYVEENPAKEDLKHALEVINELADVLGLTFEEEVPPLIRELMEIIIKVRSDMRARKDFTASDEIRKRLEEAGIVLEDRRQGTVWRFTVPLESQQ